VTIAHNNRRFTENLRTLTTISRHCYCLLLEHSSLWGKDWGQRNSCPSKRGIWMQICW